VDVENLRNLVPSSFSKITRREKVIISFPLTVAKCTMRVTVLVLPLQVARHWCFVEGGKPREKSAFRFRLRLRDGGRLELRVSP
jgi:hypothetical protein